MNQSELNLKLTLAPMVGLSHKALRALVRHYLPANTKTWWPTEMLNSRRLPYENLATTPETLRGAEEDFLMPQILGNDQDFIQKSIHRLQNEWGAWGIDINMGCPVTKALKHNYGVSLMGDMDYAARVVEYAKAAAQGPVSVKLRAGLQNDFDYLLSFVNKLIDAGVDWVTLHPRIAGDQRRGLADWEQVKNLKKQVTIPIIGNGDIQTVEDINQRFAETQCDGIMIGRALAARPWLLWQWGITQGYGLPARANLQSQVPLTPEAEAAEYLFALEFLWEELRKDLSLSLSIRKFRFYVKTTHVWLDFGHRLYSDFTMAHDDDAVISVIRRYQEQKSLRMNLRTTLCQ